jgi:hypothetical protein
MFGMGDHATGPGLDWVPGLDPSCRTQHRGILCKCAPAINQRGNGVRGKEGEASGRKILAPDNVLKPRVRE